MALTIDEIVHAGCLANNLRRLDKLVVFRPLRCLQLEEVLQIELRNVQARVGRATYRPFLSRISEEARQFLLAGARISATGRDT